MAAKCYCGCGQAPGTSCRQRLLECSVCAVKVRMTREALGAVQLSCSCGGTYVARCLEDRARAGDRDAWAELEFRLERRESRPAYGAPRNVGGRWWCSCCSGFVSGQHAECGKCRHRGPHHFGEDAPTAGNAERRQRLRQAQRARKRAYRPTAGAGRSAGDDLPF